MTIKHTFWIAVTNSYHIMTKNVTDVNIRRNKSSMYKTDDAELSVLIWDLRACIMLISKDKRFKDPHLIPNGKVV